MSRATPLLLVCVRLLSLPILEGCSKHSPTKPEPAPPYELVQAWGDSGSAEGQFSLPFGLALDRSGKVYVADAGNYRVQAFTTAGVYLSQWGDSGSANGQFKYLRNLAVGTSGSVYVVDIINHSIQKFSGDGTYLTQWGTYGSGSGQFVAPWGVAVDASENVYVTDTYNRRVEKFSSAGNYLTQWAVPATGVGVNDVPAGVAVDDSNNVYVVVSNDDHGGYPCVQKFTSDGAYLTQWGSIGRGNGQFFDPDGIAVDAAGNVYVTDTENWRIQKFTRMGAYVTQWASGGDARGVCAPGGIAVDALGNVYVTEWNFCCRIQKFAPTGTP
jgi:DNA-binding beta-propeller fold protein YncE